MATYYVFVPNSNSPTAEVEADTTKHAKTAYLDYLSRRDLITWKQRQPLRRLIKTVKSSPSEIQTAVKLSYGSVSPETREYQVPSPSTQVESSSEVSEAPKVETPTSYSPKVVPIWELSRRTGGL